MDDNRKRNTKQNSKSTIKGKLTLMKNGTRIRNETNIHRWSGGDDVGKRGTMDGKKGERWVEVC